MRFDFEEFFKDLRDEDGIDLLEMFRGATPDEPEPGVKMLDFRKQQALAKIAEVLKKGCEKCSVKVSHGDTTTNSHIEIVAKDFQFSDQLLEELRQAVGPAYYVEVLPLTNGKVSIECGIKDAQVKVE